MPDTDDRPKYVEFLKALLEQGMDMEEAENFLVRGNRIHYVNLFIPPHKLEETIKSLRKMAIVPEKTKVRFGFSTNRYDQFIKAAEEATGLEVVHGDLKPGEKVN